MAYDKHEWENGDAWNATAVNDLEDRIEAGVNGAGGGAPDDGSVSMAKFEAGLIDTDNTLAADSDSKLATQKATKGYVTTQAGLLVPKSLVDAKGDLLVGTADNTVARKAVGSNGKVLVADSGQSDGLKWGGPADIGAAVPEWRAFRSGVYYAVENRGTDTTQATTQSRLAVYPFVVPAARTFDRIGCEVTTGAGGSSLRLGIYADDGNGYPGALILDAGTVASTSNGAATITISQQLAAGLYWVGVCPQGGTPTLRGRSGTTGLGALSVTNENSCGWLQNSVTGSLPDPFSTSSPETIQSILKVMLRAA